MKGSWKVVAMVCALGGVLASCATYVVRDSGHIAVKPSSSIGVVVAGDSGQSVLADLMVASLKDRGFVARSILPTEVLPRDLLKSIETNSVYSFPESLSEQLRAGGTMKGTSTALEKLLLLNDVAEKGQRYKDLLALRDAVVADWNVDYVMFIYPSGRGFLRNPYSYSLRTIKTADREIVFDYYINANKYGWSKRIPEPKARESISISPRVLPLFMTKRRTDAVQVELCEHITTLLIAQGR